MTDVVQKWMMSGFLRDVKPNNHQLVAERLERTISRGISLRDRERLDAELMILEREGMFCTRQR